MDVWLREEKESWRMKAAIYTFRSETLGRQETCGERRLQRNVVKVFPPSPSKLLLSCYFEKRAKMSNVRYESGISDSERMEKHI